MMLARLIVLLIGLSLAAEAQSGVLLGIRDDASDANYKTYWITNSGDRPVVAAVLPDLIVPRKDGFWRVGVYHHSFYNRYDPGSMLELPGPDASYFKDIEQKLYIVPISKRPQVELSADDPLPSQEKSDEDAPNEPCTIEAVTITYLAPENIGLQNRDTQTPECEPGHYATFGTNEFLSLEQALAPANGTPRGIVILDKLSDAQKQTLRKEITEAAEEESTNREDYDLLSDLSLTVGHGGGSWNLLGWTASRTVTRGGSDYEFSLPAPATVVHSTHPQPAVAAQLRKIEGLTDYFVSPSGDLVVAFVRTKLVAYRITAGKLSAPTELAQLSTNPVPMITQWARGGPGQFTPIMAEWSVGKYVSVWDAQMKQLKLPAVETHTVKAKQ